MGLVIFSLFLLILSVTAEIVSLPSNLTQPSIRSSGFRIEALNPLSGQEVVPLTRELIQSTDATLRVAIPNFLLYINADSCRTLMFRALLPKSNRAILST